MKPYSEEKGIQYLTALVRAQFDPDAAEPPLPGTKTNQKSNEPRPEPAGDETKEEKPEVREKPQETQQPALF